MFDNHGFMVCFVDHGFMKNCVCLSWFPNIILSFRLIILFYTSIPFFLIFRI